MANLNVSSILSPKMIASAKAYAEDKIGTPDGERQIIEDAKDALMNFSPNDAINYIFLASGGRIHKVFQKVSGPTYSSRVSNGEFDDYLVDAYMLLFAPDDLAKHSPVETFNVDEYESNIFKSYQYWYGRYLENMLFKKHRHEDKMNKGFSTISLDANFGDGDNNNFESYITSAHNEFTGASSEEDTNITKIEADTKRDEEKAAAAKDDGALAKIKKFADEGYFAGKGGKKVLRVYSYVLANPDKGARETARELGMQPSEVSWPLKNVLPELLSKYGLTKEDMTRMVELYGADKIVNMINSGNPVKVKQTRTRKAKESASNPMLTRVTERVMSILESCLADAECFYEGAIATVEANKSTPSACIKMANKIIENEFKNSNFKVVNEGNNFIVGRF